MDPGSVADAGRVPHGGDRDPDVIDFSANVNPRVPEGTRRVYREAFGDARRYPDDGYPAFRAAAAEYLRRDFDETRDRTVAPDQVVPTPGGLAAIRLAVGVAVGPGDPVLVPAPSFGEYARDVRLQGGDPAFVAHDRILDADPAEYAMAIVCAPNNPTGELPDARALDAFADRCRTAGTTLLVDEAFLGFTDRASMAGRESVVVARSLTKLFGLPGIRAGFAVATGDLRDRLATARRAWNCSTPAMAVGAHCLRDEAFVAETRDRVRRERGHLQDGFEALGVGVHPSDAPYLLLDLGSRDVDAAVDGFRAQGIAVRDARTFRGLDSHVRVAVRSEGENDRLLAAARAVLGDGDNGGDGGVRRGEPGANDGA